MNSTPPVRSWCALAAWPRAHAWGAALLLAAALGIAVVLWYFVLDKTVATYAVARGDLLQSVVASGQVIMPQRASIAAEITGRIVSDRANANPVRRQAEREVAQARSP